MSRWKKFRLVVKVVELRLRYGDEVLIGATRLLFRGPRDAESPGAPEPGTNVTMVAGEPALIASVTAAMLTKAWKTSQVVIPVASRSPNRSSKRPRPSQTGSRWGTPSHLPRA